MQRRHPELFTEKIIRIAEETGHFLREERKSFRPESIVEKRKYDYVSSVDKDAERLLIGKLSELLPQAGFISEEGQAAYHGEEYCWIVDPLDGTTNYIHDLAPYCVSIALRKGSTLVCGVVYEACRRECFYAWKGGGARLNGQRIYTAQTTAIETSLIGVGLPYNYEKYRPLANDIIPRFYGASKGLRLSGSAAANLCYVAAGRFDFWFEAHIKLWDFAAGALIVTEAGGVVSGLDRGDVAASHHILASATPALHGRALETLSVYFPDIL